MIGIAVRVLDSGIHPREDAEIVEALLDFGLFDGGERISGL